jgi:hypothetical protein
MCVEKQVFFIACSAGIRNVWMVKKRGKILEINFVLAILKG